MEIKMTFMTHQIGKTQNKQTKKAPIWQSYGKSSRDENKNSCDLYKGEFDNNHKIAYLLTLWPRNPLPGIPLQDPQAKIHKHGPYKTPGNSNPESKASSHQQRPGWTDDGASRARRWGPRPTKTIVACDYGPPWKDLSSMLLTRKSKAG